MQNLWLTSVNSSESAFFFVGLTVRCLCIVPPATLGCRHRPLYALSKHTDSTSFELHGQLTFITSSQKKRRITRQSRREQQKSGKASAPNLSTTELVLPTTEEETDSTFSFSGAPTTSLISGLSTPAYVRGDSLPAASGVPPRLQTHSSSVTAPDYYTSSAASSPCAASADFSVDNDRGADFLDPGSTLQPPLPPDSATGSAVATSQSPLIHAPRSRALMGGAADLPQRSSSPLKRRASSMDNAAVQDDKRTDSKEDVDMINVPDAPQEQQGPQQQEDAKQQSSQGEDMQQPATGASQDEVEDVPVVSMKTELPLRSDIPPVEQQVKTIETLVKAFAETPAQEGDTVYLVSRKWLGRAQAFGADAKHASKESLEGSLGPVDNADIIQTIFTDSAGQHCVKLKPGTGTENFELFPKDAWDLLLSWYGLAAGQSPIVRTAHNTAPDSVSLPNIQFEFHPPVFTIHRLWSAVSPIPLEQETKLKKPPPPVIVQSTSFGYHNFLKQAKELTGVSLERKVRLWRVLQTIPATETSAQSSGIKTPPDSPERDYAIPSGAPVSPGSWPEMLVDVETFVKLERDVERGLVDAEDTTTNPNYNGKKSLSLVGLTVDQTLVIDELVERDYYVSTFKGNGLKDKALATRGSSSSLAAQARGNASGRSSPAPLGPVTRGRAQQKSGRTIGSVGLQNLGNTCYMNSALQCVRSVEELTKYFLTHEAQKEINPDNPLSHNGDVAAAYGRLLGEIYKDPAPSSVAPRHFKSIIGRYAPAFSGYGQQDSQEFVGFLLDGLQEDLNRIKKKPYIEKPDSTDDMINNPAAIREMAEKVWDITKKRDDSVIADLFTGMYKSTLVCPVCDKVSITFDPFNNLTLPLPVANVWSRTVRYFPLNDTPVDIMVDIDKNSSVKTLKQFISDRVGVPVERLFGAEEFRDKFFKFYEDMSSVSEEIQTNANDNPTIHELEAAPTNTSGVKAKPKKQQQRYRSLLDDNDQQEEPQSWEDPMAERLLVPVIHRMNPEEPSFRKHRYARSKNSGDVPPPHFIVLTPEEARNEDVIRRKVLEKVATFSTWTEFSAADESDGSETTDPEMVNTASDADSSGDAKVVAKSVEGEEDIVDVTMKDASDGPKAATRSSSGPAKECSRLLKQFKNKRPKWVNPLEFLDPQFQNLFELSYYHETGTVLPTGWQSVQEDNSLPRLSTRQPKPVLSDVEMRSPGAWDGSDESGSDEVAHLPPNQQTRMADEDESSEEDDSPLPKVANVPRVNGHNFKNQVSGRGKNKKMKPGKTCSKKSKKRFEKQLQQQKAARSQQSAEMLEVEDSGAVDNGPLIRIGEGLIVDWNEGAFEAVFGGTSPDEMKGMRTYARVETLEDPGLEAKKKQRQLRKKHGISLDDCLAEFEKEEILSEQDTWYCPRCKEHRRASKKFDLWKTPDILVVHLKRFSSSGWRRDKLDIHVDFPIEGLDLTERVIDQEDGKQEIYDLIAVDDHWGGLGGGHYTAFAQNFIDGEWYEYNDTAVSKAKDPARIVTNAAYLLFYRRRSKIPLGGPRFQEIFERYNNQTSADEDMLDSGEGRRLGQGSSHCGSPSASTGAGPILPRGNLGSASGHPDLRIRLTPAKAAAVAAAISGNATGNDDADQPPPYDDDTDMGATLPWPDQEETLHNSIEGEDEGIVLSDYDNAGPGAAGIAGMTSVISSNWSFGNLLNKAGSEATGTGTGVNDIDDDLASDVAQNNNSSNDAFGDNTMDDLEPMLLTDDPPSRADGGDGELLSYDIHDVPPAPAEDYMSELASAVWEKQHQDNHHHQQVLHTIPAAALVADDQVSDKVAEIHVGEEEDDQRQQEKKENYV
ncbi:hypothetical protein QBC46DRAFT_436430 [Diplogelasinospora grovesii]|uniref:ubiquitinyl hydrolase 1 n=1 Tax=Diplogelasinospora grovesii TaxID=303347 RepID=A0AAN6N6U5_9PEZI|nr:hypothetical protein QBC46DRAFT_436430 [Diplogelasinospora grovesii]